MCFWDALGIVADVSVTSAQMNTLTLLGTNTYMNGLPFLAMGIFLGIWEEDIRPCIL